jgi:hypothetical protein
MQRKSYHIVSKHNTLLVSVHESAMPGICVIGVGQQVVELTKEEFKELMDLNYHVNFVARTVVVATDSAEQEEVDA